MTEAIISCGQPGASSSKPKQHPYNKMRRPSKSMRSRYIKKLLKVDDRCYYCRIKLQLPIDGKQANDTVTLEHRIPIIKGGHGRDLRNIVLACFACNRNKGDMTEEEYRASAKFVRRHNTLRNLGMSDKPVDRSETLCNTYRS